MTVFLPAKWANDGKDAVFILEFKVKEYTKNDVNSALQQIKEKKYYEKFDCEDIFLIGAEFSKEQKNIIDFEWEKM